MSVQTMGVRAALRSMQTKEKAPSGVVVSGILPAGTPQVSGTPTEEIAGTTDYLSKIAAWIPSEALALWLALAGPFAVTEDTSKEFGLLGAVLILTVVLSWSSTSGAHSRRGLSSDSKKNIIVSLIASVSFLLWWAATPGTWITADEGVSPFWVALVLAVVTVLLPVIAQRLGVEPKTE